MPNVKEQKERGVTTKYLGLRTFQDLKTGEVVELQYVEKEVQHTLKRGWRRVYLENFMEILSTMYSQARRIDVVEFILNNLNSENQLTMTQKQIAEKSGISNKTITETYKHLVKNNFMKKSGAVYVVNPKFVCAFGSDKKNATIAIKYSQKEKSLFDEAE